MKSNYHYLRVRICRKTNLSDFLDITLLFLKIPTLILVILYLCQFYLDRIELSTLVTKLMPQICQLSFQGLTIVLQKQHKSKETLTNITYCVTNKTMAIINSYFHNNLWLIHLTPVSEWFIPKVGKQIQNPGLYVTHWFDKFMYLHLTVFEHYM